MRRKMNRQAAQANTNSTANSRTNRSTPGGSNSQSIVRLSQKPAANSATNSAIPSAQAYARMPRRSRASRATIAGAN